MQKDVVTCIRILHNRCVLRRGISLAIFFQLSLEIKLEFHEMKQPQYTNY